MDNPLDKPNDSIKQEVTHPWQGHYMEDAFLSFVDYIINTPERLAEFDKHASIGLDLPMDNDALQALFDFACIQYGTPSDLEVCDD